LAATFGLDVRGEENEIKFFLLQHWGGLVNRATARSEMIFDQDGHSHANGPRVRANAKNFHDRWYIPLRPSIFMTHINFDVQDG
jgi:hypothetical protein